MNEIAYALYESANYLGLLFVLKPFGTNIKIKLPLSKAFCEQSIQSLDLPVCSKNLFISAGADNVGKLVDLIMPEEGTSHIQNIEQESINKIKTLLLVKAYEELNDRERLDFWHDFIRENKFPNDIVNGGMLRD